jgi:hypothetical protein
MISTPFQILAGQAKSGTLYLYFAGSNRSLPAK